MKIVTRKQLMNMPSGTVFSYYEPCCFTGFMVKDSEPETDYPDFVISNLFGEIDCTDPGDFSDKCEIMERGGSVPTDLYRTQREGLFDDSQLFAIYEKEDILKLISRLQNTL